MMPLRRPGATLVSAVVLGLTPAAAEAQAAESIGSEGAEPLEPIVITSSRAARGSQIQTEHSLGRGAVATIDARSADQILSRLPSADVAANSRGEFLIFVRNAGERQVALFYEGAAINLPWDNRLDLAAVPAGLIGDARVAAGPLPPRYGVNALAAVTLLPRQAADGAEGLMLAGQGALLDARLFLPVVTGTLDAAIGGGIGRRRGETLSGEARLAFGQRASGLRTNTDGTLASLHGRAALTTDDHMLSVTAFHIWGEKGVAPECDRPDARFWRYPLLRHSLAVVNFNSPAGIESAVWLQRFRQTIDSYTDRTYQTIDARQVERDETLGIRSQFTRHIGRAELSGSFSVVQSAHRQGDIPFAAGVAPPERPSELLFSQRNWSGGIEAQSRFSPTILAGAALGYDRVEYLRTGDKPPIRDARGWTGRAGLSWSKGEWQIRLTAGAKRRMPTMRELFCQAIGRFLVNPDLRPERVLSGEAGIEWRVASGGLFVIPFAQRIRDTIDQRTVGRLRQRVNLEGSTVLGIELGGDWRPRPDLQIVARATASRVRRARAVPGESRRLPEKPSLLASLRLAYDPAAGFGGELEANHIGRAFSADPEGKLVPLSRSTSFNARLRYALDRENRTEFFVRMDNAFDVLIERQIGLPSPGRTVLLGISLRE